MPTASPTTEIEIRLKLTQDARNALVERACKEGQAIEEYASRLVERAMLGQAADEALAPFRKQVAESGMSDQELDAFFQSQIDAHRREKRAERS